MSPRIPLCLLQRIQMNNRVSIILPAFNAQKTLSDALQSLENQTYTHWECIVIDDGSTDETAEIARKWQNKNTQFKLITQPHKGISAALNAGLHLAGGNYIARQDADDMSIPCRLEKQVEFLNESKSTGCVSTQVEYTGDPGEHAGFYEYVEWANSIHTPQDHSINRFIEAPLIHPTIMIRKEIINKYGGYTEKQNWPEDFDLWLRLMNAGVEFAKIPEKLYMWHESSHRLSRTHDNYSTEAFYDCKAYHLMKGPLSEQKKCVIIGAGRRSRQRAELLVDYGCEIECYIDINPHLRNAIIQGRRVYMTDQLNEIPDIPVISYVGTRGAREKIRELLCGTRFIEGKNAWYAA